MKTFPYEKKIIDPILKTIRKYQEYLTEPENLPQLAKLGYMYNTLWYAGRICWGWLYGEGGVKPGILRPNARGNGQCEDNPKYKIEMCNPKNERIDALIYDAWGMHVSDESMKDEYDWDTFRRKIYQGKELTDYDRLVLKPNKTVDEWVEVKMHPQYRYHGLYHDRKRVIDYLLFRMSGTMINKEGFVFEGASGADQDTTLYGDWINAKFHPDIQKVVDSILAYPEVKQTLDAAYDFMVKAIKEREDKEKAVQLEFKRRMFESRPDLVAQHGTIEKYLEWLDEPEIKLSREQETQERIKKYFAETSDEYSPYYPVSQYANISNFDENTHPSYIYAGIEACNEILENQDKERPENVKFAKKFLAKFESYESTRI